jgi:hypothetical protein
MHERTAPNPPVENRCDWSGKSQRATVQRRGEAADDDEGDFSVAETLK